MAEVLTMSIRIYFISDFAEKTLMSDSNNNELLIINLATVKSDRNPNSMSA